MSEERMLPRIGAPESAMQAGMSAALVFDSSLPGPFSQPGPPRPVTWVYDFDPATGQSRATFEGEVVAGTISTPAAGVSAFNGRTGSVTLEAADVTAAGGIANPSPALAGTPTAPTAAPGTASTQLATTQFVASAIAASAGVTTFNGRAGAVSLTTADVTNAGGAPVASPALTGVPTAPTPAATDNSSSLATTAFVNNYAAANLTLSFNGRRGNVVLSLSDVETAGGAPIASPSFTGTPTAATAAPGTATQQLATCAFVENAVVAASSGVVSFNGRNGVVTLTTADVVNAGGAPLSSPALVGVPTAPTASAGNNSTQIATTAFVETAITSMAPVVTSFNGRTGTVALQLADVTAVGGAPLASPTFSGSVSAPEAAPGDNSSLVATTSFVDRAIAAIPAGVASWNGRTGAVTLTGGDITGAGGALQSSLASYVPLAGGVTVTGALTLSGGISGGLGVNGGNLSVSGNGFFAGNSVVLGAQGVGTNPTFTQQSAGNLNIWANTGSNLASINLYATTIQAYGTAYIQTVAPRTDNTYLCGFGGAAWQGVYSYFFGTESDRGLKTDIEPLPECLPILTRLDPSRFKWSNEPLDHPHRGDTHWGFVAQDVEEAFEGLAFGGWREEEGQQSICYNELVAVLWKAVQELKAEVEELKAGK